MLEPEDTKLTSISDIRLGWIQRFLAVARSANLAKASAECHVDPTSLADSIYKLSEALRWPLLLPTTARLLKYGKAFVPTAEAIIEMADVTSRPMTNVSIGWLRSLVAISETGTYVGAGKSLGVTREKVRRGIKGLEEWLGEDIVWVSDRVLLTRKGLEILEIARGIVPKLENFRNKHKSWPDFWLRRPNKNTGWVRLLFFYERKSKLPVLQAGSAMRRVKGGSQDIHHDGGCD